LIWKGQARGGRGISWDGGARGGSNDDESIIILVDVTGGIDQRCKNLEKQMCVKKLLAFC
jgi:hypothetical protein